MTAFNPLDIERLYGAKPFNRVSSPSVNNATPVASSDLTISTTDSSHNIISVGSEIGAVTGISGSTGLGIQYYIPPRTTTSNNIWTGYQETIYDTSIFRFSDPPYRTELEIRLLEENERLFTEYQKLKEDYDKLKESFEFKKRLDSVYALD